MLFQLASYTCKVSGSGLKSATVNQPAKCVVELKGSSGRPCLYQQNVSASIKHVSLTAADPKTAHNTTVTVSIVSPSLYEVEYKVLSRGQYKLHIQVNGKDINNSPFTVTVYPDPTQVGFPVKVVTGFDKPYGVAFDSHSNMIVSEWGRDRIVILSNRGQKIQLIGNDQIVYPTGIAIDQADNVYVSSSKKLQKFSRGGKLIKSVDKGGREREEFAVLRGLTLYQDQIYVCERDFHRIQVFDLDLTFIRSIGSYGDKGGEFNKPHDVQFDTASGDMYVADLGNSRVQVFDNSGHFQCAFGQEKIEKLDRPTGLLIADKYIYVSDNSSNCVLVFDILSAEFITSFGGHGQEGELHGPRCISSCTDGFIYVCDQFNDRIVTF